MNFPIQATALKKSFGSFEAIKGLDLTVQPGECLGLLGPNGAGKSTFISSLYGVVKRSSGELKVFGMDPDTQAREIKKRIGVVPQENALDEGLTVIENMQIYARFVGLPTDQREKRIDELLEYMALGSKKNNMIRMLSGGMKRRLAFVRALLASPELLILDEPTTGLDPGVRHLLWEKVREFKRQGKTVLVTTHYMHEAEVLCDRIVIMNLGKAVAEGTPAELIQQHSPGYVAVLESSLSDLDAILQKLRDQFGSTAEVFEMGKQPCVRAKDFQALLNLSNQGFKLLILRPSNLEDVYLKLTGHELGGNLDA